VEESLLMVVYESDKAVTADKLLSEHDIVLSRVTELCKFAFNHLNLLRIYAQSEYNGRDFIDKIIGWKSAFKAAAWPFFDYLKDHVERETVFLDVLSKHELNMAAVKKEEVLEHLDELTWLLDNIPNIKMVDFSDYLKQKMEELSQAVSEHCEWVNPILKLTQEIEEV
jgi:hypothetical protein